MICAEAMLLEYNRKKKNPAQRLSLGKLHVRASSIIYWLDSSEISDDEIDDYYESVKGRDRYPRP